jgi:hypothetical protein
MSWLYYDVVVPVAGVVAALIAVVTLPRLLAPAIAVLLLLVMAMRPGYLPAMYVIQALPYLSLCIAGVLAGAVGVVLNRGPLSSGGWRWARVAVVAVVAVGMAAYAVPRWAEGDRIAMTRDANVENRAAVAALAALPHDENTRVLVDDGLWLDLVAEGYQPGRGAIWFYKLDLDPAIRLENGWRDVHYVVSTPILRESMTNLAEVTRAMDNSVVVQTFGTGAARIEIRRVVPS